jgi:hypothetical protein
MPPFPSSQAVSHSPTVTRPVNGIVFPAVRNISSRLGNGSLAFNAGRISPIAAVRSRSRSATSAPSRPAPSTSVWMAANVSSACRAVANPPCDSTSLSPAAVRNSV